MPCMCGDLCCPSCGPAQGNHPCPICGTWATEHETRWYRLDSWRLHQLRAARYLRLRYRFARLLGRCGARWLEDGFLDCDCRSCAHLRGVLENF